MSKLQAAAQERCSLNSMNPVRDAEKHNSLMAQGEKKLYEFGRLMTAYGSAKQNKHVVDHYFFNQIASPVASTSGASYL